MIGQAAGAAVEDSAGVLRDDVLYVSSTALSLQHIHAHTRPLCKLDEATK